MLFLNLSISSVFVSSGKFKLYFTSIPACNNLLLPPVLVTSVTSTFPGSTPKDAATPASIPSFTSGLFKTSSAVKPVMTISCSIVVPITPSHVLPVNPG